MPIVGTGKEGCSGYGGPAIKATLGSPLSPVFDEVGNLYFTDQKCHLVFRVARDGILSIVAG